MVNSGNVDVISTEQNMAGCRVHPQRLSIWEHKKQWMEEDEEERKGDNRE